MVGTYSCKLPFHYQLPVQNAVYPFMQLFYGSIAFGLIVYKTTSAFLKDHGHGGVRALMVEKCIYYA